jgi:hypothetical protein
MQFFPGKSTLSWLVPAVAAVVCALSASAVASGPDDTKFRFVDEFYGSRGYTDPTAAANLESGMANGVSFLPPVDSGMAQFVTSRNVNLIVNLPGSAAAGAVSANYINVQRAGMASLAGKLGFGQLAWNLMAEWDQAGGAWVPNGRPTYEGLSRNDAYAQFLTYYLTQTPPLATYLSQPASQRAFTLAAVTDFPANTYYAYEMGIDLGLLERSIDELGDLSTGIAFMRGAARQYDRKWGIDISTWRTSNGMATTFDPQGTLLGGWSPSYLKRHYYAAYMSGAQVIQNEPTTYYSSGGGLNPFGQMTKEFADFVINRHPDVGVPSVAMALLVDHTAGFDPKHWLYNQSNQVWYGDIPYTDGDYMIDNFLKLAYPYHWLHGLTPGAPFADSMGKADPVKFRAYLAAGGDPRPYEPMPFTRWGDNIDVLTTHATLDALRNYKTIVLLGDLSLTPQLQADLQEWVAEGGVLVVNVNQAAGFDRSFLGVESQNIVRRARSSRWVSDRLQASEPAFLYTVAAPTTADVLATTGCGAGVEGNAGNGNRLRPVAPLADARTAGANCDPLVMSNVVGQGFVISTTPAYTQSRAKDQILNVGAKLFDWLQATYSLAHIDGPPVEYIVNQASYGVVITLLNHSGAEWNGTIATRALTQVSAAREFTTDQDVPYATSGTTTQVAARVPAYDVRVYAISGAVAGNVPLPMKAVTNHVH